MKVLLLLSLIFCLSFEVFAQIDTTNWYPLQVGNIWEFSIYASVTESYTFTSEVLDDTLINGNVFYKIKVDSQIEFQRLENNERVWEYNVLTNQEYVRYDFVSPDKSIWELDSNNGMYGIYETFPFYVYIYGDTLNSKIFNSVFITSSASTTDTTWGSMVDGLAVIVTKGLGVTAYGAGINPVSFVGAIINGEQIGYISDVHENLELPEVIVLKQNYPNPFNPTTNIEFAIPETEYVELNIYNSIGQKIKSLLSKTISSGNYNIKFDAENLSSGIYFYQLKTKNYINVKKMLLLR